MSRVDDVLNYWQAWAWEAASLEQLLPPLRREQSEEHSQLVAPGPTRQNVHDGPSIARKPTARPPPHDPELVHEVRLCVKRMCARLLPAAARSFRRRGSAFPRLGLS